MTDRHWVSLLPTVDAHVATAYERLVGGATDLAKTAYATVRSPLSSGPTPAQEAAAATVRGYLPWQRGAAALRVHHDAVYSRSPSSIFRDALVALDHGVPWKRPDLDWALHLLVDEPGFEDGDVFHLPARIAAGMSREALTGLEPLLRALLEEVLDRRLYKEQRQELVALLGAAIDRVSGEAVPARLLHDGDRFGPLARETLADVLAAKGVAEALVHAETLRRPVPPARWNATAEPLAEPAADAIRALLDLYAGYDGYLESGTDDLVRGLACMLAIDSSDAATDLLARVATTAASAPRDARGYPYAPKTAAAAVLLLAGRAGDVPARTLAKLSLAVRNKALLARVRSALDALGALRGWQPGEAQEIAVDDHGLDADGRRSWEHEAHTIVLELTEEKPRLRYERAGAPLTSTPDAVKGTPALAEAKERLKQLTATVAAERARVEALLSEARTWPLADWTARYARHPVTALFARRLVWEVSTDGTTWKAAMPCLDGDAFAVPDASVRLWHPLTAGAAEVAAWRDRIESTGVRQPFKQAFREIYRLTPAEVDAGTASSRFAGHILRYRQANALMRTRGWGASYLGTWDGGYQSEATKVLGGGVWRASLSHERAGDVVPPRYDVEHCVTGTVVFVRRDGADWTPARLTEVPPRAFSEAMRDVDLFVGVTSIGTDDVWAGRGGHEFYRYWADAGIGALTARAEVRRDALARILPKLRIADRCELQERFLRVTGKLRAYRIHLGSGNILMEPDDAYLCIIPKRNLGASIALPFDDDALLSVILSKALLLVADDKIRDPSILDQIRARPDH